MNRGELRLDLAQSWGSYGEKSSRGKEIYQSQKVSSTPPYSATHGKLARICDWHWADLELVACSRFGPIMSRAPATEETVEGNPVALSGVIS